MELEGVAGSGGCRGVLDGGLDTVDAAVLRLSGAGIGSVEILVTGSTLKSGRGGGNGEMDTEVTEAEWA